MSVSTEMQVKDAVSPQIVGLIPALSGDKLHKAIGVETQQVFKSNFYKLNQEKHRGITTTGFYEEAAKSTHWDLINGGVRITSNKIGVLQRLMGGPIVAGAGGSGRKYLTIPATLYYGAKGAREFSNLKVAWGHQKWNGGKIGPIGLMVTKNVPKSKKLGGYKSSPQKGDMAFWFVPAVAQKANPNVLPPEEEIKAGINRAITNYLKAL